MARVPGPPLPQAGGRSAGRAAGARERTALSSAGWAYGTRSVSFGREGGRVGLGQRARLDQEVEAFDSDAAVVVKEGEADPRKRAKEQVDRAAEQRVQHQQPDWLDAGARG